LYLLLSMSSPSPGSSACRPTRNSANSCPTRTLDHRVPRYPLLQTADIIIYNAHYVPVGEDQVPQPGTVREAVAASTQFYGEVFVEPSRCSRAFRGCGPRQRKMSKSYGNAIDLADDAEAVRKRSCRCTRIPSGSAPNSRNSRGEPRVLYHDAFNPDAAEVDDLKARYRRGRSATSRSSRSWPAPSMPCSSRCGSAARRLSRGPFRARGPDGGFAPRPRGWDETMEHVREAVKLRYV